MPVGSTSTELDLDKIRACFANAEDINVNAGRELHSKQQAKLRKEKPTKPVSARSQLSRVSPVSRVSTPSMVNETWCEFARDAFEERAAILEFEAGLPRAMAEYLARSQVELVLSQTTPHVQGGGGV